MPNNTDAVPIIVTAQHGRRDIKQDFKASEAAFNREHVPYRRERAKESRETRWRHRRLDADMDLMIESLNT